MAIYSVLLGLGHGRATGDTLLYTAPASGVVVVRDIVLCVTSTPPSYIAVYSLVPGGDLAYLASQAAPVALQSYHWSLRQVLSAGEQLYVSGGSAALRYRVSGYLLGV